MVDWSGAVSSHTRTTDASTAATAPSRDASLKRATAPVDDIMAPKGANDILAATTARRTRRRRGAASRNGARARPTRDGSIGGMDRRRRRASWERGCAGCFRGRRHEEEGFHLCHRLREAGACETLKYRASGERATRDDDEGRRLTMRCSLMRIGRGQDYGDWLVHRVPHRSHQGWW